MRSFLRDLSLQESLHTGGAGGIGDRKLVTVASLLPDVTNAFGAGWT